MRAVAVVLLLAHTAALLACSGSHAGLEIEDARAWRGLDRRVIVDIDLVAHEALGGNIGTYCTRVTFDGQPDPVEECRADLEDGDTRTVRFISKSEMPEGAAINVRVRHAAVDIGRSLVAPKKE